MRMRFHKNQTTTTSTTKTIMQFALWKFRSTKKKQKTNIYQIDSFLLKINVISKCESKAKNLKWKLKQQQKKREKNNGTNTTIEMAFNWHEIGFIRLFDI